MESYKDTDLIGKKFNRFTIIKRDINHNGLKHFICQCDCDEIKSVRLSSLINGHSKSCGCLKSEINSKNGKLRMTTHGGTKTRLYHIWTSLRRKCYNKKNDHYKWYGARGIKVCDEWMEKYENFRDWALENGYSDKLTIDRIDNNGNYTPSNCRWATMKEQSNNRRSNVYITYKGKTKNLKQWSEYTGIPLTTLCRKIRKNNYSILD